MKDRKINKDPVSFDFVMHFFRGLPHDQLRNFYFKGAERWWQVFLSPLPVYQRRYNIFRKES